MLNTETTQFLIDSENVPLPLLIETLKEFNPAVNIKKKKFVLFLNKATTSSKMIENYINTIEAFSNDLTIKEINNSRKDALDFYIISYIGLNLSSSDDIFLISDDKGFDIAIDLYQENKRNGLLQMLRTSFTYKEETPTQDTKFQKLDNDSIDRAYQIEKHSFSKDYIRKITNQYIKTHLKERLPLLNDNDVMFSHLYGLFSESHKDNNGEHLKSFKKNYSMFLNKYGKKHPILKTKKGFCYNLYRNKLGWEEKTIIDKILYRKSKKYNII